MTAGQALARAPLSVHWAGFGKGADDSQSERILGFTAKFGVDASQKTPKLKPAAAAAGAAGGG